MAAAARYVALIGKGTSIRRIQGDETNRFPVLMAATPYGLYASDNRYAKSEGDRVPEIAMGRIPALNNEDVNRTSPS